MADILTLDAAKAHLRVDGTDQDDYIADLIRVAIGALEDFLGRPLIDPDLGWASEDLLPANIIHGAKIILTELYDERERPLEDVAALRNLVGRYIVISVG